MKLNITPGPWDIEIEYLTPWIYTKSSATNGNVVCQAPDGDLELSNKFFLDNCKAIVTAVNNTYHKGINPEAVPDLLKISVEVRNWYEENHFKYMGEDTPVCFSKLLSVIQKATL